MSFFSCQRRKSKIKPLQCHLSILQQSFKCCPVLCRHVFNFLLYICVEIFDLQLFCFLVYKSSYYLCVHILVLHIFAKILQSFYFFLADVCLSISLSLLCSFCLLSRKKVKTKQEQKVRFACLVHFSKGFFLFFFFILFLLIVFGKRLKVFVDCTKLSALNFSAKVIKVLPGKWKGRRNCSQSTKPTRLKAASSCCWVQS